MSTSKATCYAEFGVISPSLHISSMIAMLWLVYQYAKSMKSEQNQTLKHMGFTLFSMQMMYCMVTGSKDFVWAFTSDCVFGIELLKGSCVVTIMLFVSRFLYFAQYAVMISLLFYRLKVVFDGTAYELSQCTKWTFYIMCLMSILPGIRASLLLDWSGRYSLIGTILTVLCIVMALSIIIFLTFLFVTKLIAVNKHCDGTQPNDENKMLSAITKQCILTLTSIASLLLFGTMFLLYYTTGLLVSSIHANFIYALLSLIDVWTNFSCILLTYRSFNEYYTKMCGCWDAKCKQLCSKLVKPQKHEVTNADPISE